MPRARTNGIETAYDDTGSGPPVVFIHGHSLDRRMWKYQLADVTAAGYRAITYDVRGHGESEVPRDGYTWENYARDLVALLDHLGVDAAHVVASSMGGGIALQFALEYPQRVRTLTLVDSALPGFGYSGEVSETIQGLVEAVRDEGAATAFERLWLTHTFFDGVRRHPDRFAEAREMVVHYAAPEYQPDYEPPAGYAQPDILGRLGEIRAPALVIAGDRDLADFVLIADLLAENLPDARKLTFEGAYHLPNMEDPERFNRALLDFLAAHTA